MAWFSPGADPAKPWEMHPVSAPSEPGKVVPGTSQFSHGLGVGDLNGDGRKDVISTGTAKMDWKAVQARYRQVQDVVAPLRHPR